MENNEQNTSLHAKNKGHHEKINTKTNTHSTNIQIRNCDHDFKHSWQKLYEHYASLHVINFANIKQVHIQKTRMQGFVGKAMDIM